MWIWYLNTTINFPRPLRCRGFVLLLSSLIDNFHCILSWWITYKKGCVKYEISRIPMPRAFMLPWEGVLDPLPCSQPCLWDLPIPRQSGQGCAWISSKLSTWVKKQTTGYAPSEWQPTLDSKGSTLHLPKTPLGCPQTTNNAFDSQKEWSWSHLVASETLSASVSLKSCWRAGVDQKTHCTMMEITMQWL